MNFITLPIVRNIMNRESLHWFMDLELINLDLIINIRPSEIPDPSNRCILVQGCVLLTERDTFHTTVPYEELTKIIKRYQHKLLTFA